MWLLLLLQAAAPANEQLSTSSSAASRSSQLESLILGAAGNLPVAVIDLQQDADDEAMMELAIALSLQEQSGGAPSLQLQGLSQGQMTLALEGGNLSDATASGICCTIEYKLVIFCNIWQYLVINSSF